MDGDPNGNANNGPETDWVWIPNTSYGPFTFGNHRSETPHVGPFIERTEMGPADYLSDYESERGDIDLSFWNEYLTSVAVRDTFVIDDIELIGATFNDVRNLVNEEPEVDDLVLTFSATFRDHNMMWFMNLDWRITEVDVGMDPDLIPSLDVQDPGTAPAR